VCVCVCVRVRLTYTHTHVHIVVVEAIKFPRLWLMFYAGARTGRKYIVVLVVVLRRPRSDENRIYAIVRIHIYVCIWHAVIYVEIYIYICGYTAFCAAELWRGNWSGVTKRSKTIAYPFILSDTIRRRRVHQTSTARILFTRRRPIFAVGKTIIIIIIINYTRIYRIIAVRSGSDGTTLDNILHLQQYYYYYRNIVIDRRFAPIAESYLYRRKNLRRFSGGAR